MDMVLVIWNFFFDILINNAYHVLSDVYVVGPHLHLESITMESPVNGS
jgi:hypothetical protein